MKKQKNNNINNNPAFDMIYQCDKLEYAEMDIQIAHYCLNNFTIADEDDVILAIHHISFDDKMHFDEEWDMLFTKRDFIRATVDKNSISFHDVEGFEDEEIKLECKMFVDFNQEDIIAGENDFLYSDCGEGCTCPKSIGKYN